MNTLQPEERRAKADEIARLLDKEPLMVQDILPLLSGEILMHFSNYLPEPDLPPPCESCGDHEGTFCERCTENLREELADSEAENEALSTEVRELKETLADALLELEKQKELYRITIAP